MLLFLTATDHEACLARYVHRAPTSGAKYFHAFDSVFIRVGTERNVDPALLKSIAWCESDLYPCATSPAGARGLMQFIDQTWMSVAEAAGAVDPYDPEHSIRAAGVYVATLINYWQGNLEAVVASYNAGPAAVARAIRRGRIVPRIAETQDYVACVLGAYAHLRTANRRPAVRSISDLFSLFGESAGGL
jgi:soluble lytic murein transglycosylase-like protein